MMITRGAGVALALVAFLATAGCAQADALQQPSEPAGIPSATVSPSPTKQPVPDRLPALKDLVITPAGIGSLLVGQPVSQTDMTVFEPEFCELEGIAAFHADGTPVSYGRWVPNYPKTDRGYHLFDVSIEGDTVLSIELTDPTLRTPEGIGVGSSIAELSAAYPSLSVGAEGPLSKSLVHATNAGDIEFEVLTVDIGEEHIHAGDVGTMRIFPPGLAENILRAGGDGGYASCM